MFEFVLTCSMWIVIAKIFFYIQRIVRNQILVIATQWSNYIFEWLLSIISCTRRQDEYEDKGRHVNWNRWRRAYITFLNFIQSYEDENKQRTPWYSQRCTYLLNLLKLILVTNVEVNQLMMQYNASSINVKKTFHTQQITIILSTIETMSVYLVQNVRFR